MTGSRRRREVGSNSVSYCILCFSLDPGFGHGNFFLSQSDYFFIDAFLLEEVVEAAASPRIGFLWFRRSSVFSFFHRHIATLRENRVGSALLYTFLGPAEF
jgi:hypothetical protein